ncbi:MAG TPA: 2OG-Fe(II) oxygenase [Thermoanaerobaculia bacterium]|jgi:hypothetical protein
MRELNVDGRKILVVDDVVTGERLRNLVAWFDLAPARRIEGDDAASEQRSWVVPLDAASAPSQPYFEPMMSVVRTHFGGDYLVQRTYCNVVSFGEQLLPHRDSPRDGDVTALLYLATEWPRQWEGETLFYDRDGEAAVAVSPRPGRMVAFDASIEHRGTPPSRLCPRTRLTLALKLTRRA